MLRLFLAASLMMLTTINASAYKNKQDLRVQRWLQAEVNPKYKPHVDKVVRRILLHRNRYESVEFITGVPWYVIAGIHNMESGGSFKHHLHEGSPLRGKTRWHPKGRPLWGKPPYTWEQSALDALVYDKMLTKQWSYLFDTLWAVECYNGPGYWRYHRDVPTPYLYAKTTIERPGKYIADGKWSSTAVSKQVGVAAIWKLMITKQQMALSHLR